jgi:hypothetical protein
VITSLDDLDLAVLSALLAVAKTPQFIQLVTQHRINLGVEPLAEEAHKHLGHGAVAIRGLLNKLEEIQTASLVVDSTA